MRKKLTRLGNGLALIFDQPLLRLLGVDRDTWLRMTVDEGRLIIEPMAPFEMDDDRSWGGPSNFKRSIAEGNGPPRARTGPVPEIVEAQRIVDEVRRTIPQEQILRLFENGGRGWRLHWLGVEGAMARWYVTQPKTGRINRRLRVCLEQRQAGASWDEAVAAATAEVPSLEVTGEEMICVGDG